MMKTLLRGGAATILLVAMSMPVEATHFRGAAMVPEVSASGLLTVTSTSFWRKGYTEELFPEVAGVGVMTETSESIDTSDARFNMVTQTHTIQLPGAGTYDIASRSCCRVDEGGLANWSESWFTMDSRIVWDGSTAASPINFNFASVQPEVSRLGSYSDNLGAVSPDGLSLSYNLNLNESINFLVPGLTVDSTGQLSIPGANTPSITDNTSNSGQNVGADAAFSGNILASDGSSVEFDWMFDGVDSAINNAPEVSDGNLQDIVGTIFNFMFSITDPDGDPTSFDPGLFASLGPTPAIAPVFNYLTGQLTWNSAGSAPGTYIFQVRGRDSGNLTDVGSLTVDLQQQQNGAIPEPGSLLVHAGLFVFALTSSMFRRRR